MTALLLALVLSGDADRLEVSSVPCSTVDECWLDAKGHPVARPKRSKGKALPTGDCGKQLHWLRHRLSCDEARHVCVALEVGDRC